MRNRLALLLTPFFGAVVWGQGAVLPYPTAPLAPISAYSTLCNSTASSAIPTGCTSINFGASTGLHFRSNGGFLTPGLFTSGNSLTLAGDGSGGSVSNIFTVPLDSVSSAMTFVRPLVVSATGASSTTVTPNFKVNTSASGTVTSGQATFNAINVNSDALNTTGGGGPGGAYNLYVGQTVNNALMTGHRTSLDGLVFVTGPSGNGIGTSYFYTGTAGQCNASANDNGASGAGNAVGACFGGFFSSRLQSGATFYKSAVGVEIDEGIDTGGSAAYETGLQVVHWATAAVKGSVESTALSFSDQTGATAAWDHLIGVGSTHGIFPVNGGTIMGGVPTTLGGSAYSVAHGIDFVNGSPITCTVDCFRSNGFKVDGSGNVTGNSFASAGILDANAYGFVCDGATDNATAMAALNTAIAALGSAGGTVNFPPQTAACLTSVALVPKTNVSVRAIPGTVILKPTAASTANPLLLSVSGGGQSNIFVYGLTFDGGGIDLASANNVISIGGVSNAVLDTVTVQNTHGRGAFFGGNVTYSGVRNSLFKNVGNHWKTTLDRLDRWPGVLFQTVATNKSNFLRGNYFEDIGLDAMAVLNQTNFNVSNNTCYIYNNQYGLITSVDFPNCIYFSTNNGGSINGNVVAGANGNGIGLATSTNVTVTGNFVRDSGSAGITVPTGDAGITVTGNTVLDNNQNATGNVHSGIVVTGTTNNVTISGNTAYDDQGGGKTQLYGLEYSTYEGAVTATNIQVSGNNFAGNLTGDVGGAPTISPGAAYNAHGITVLCQSGATVQSGSVTTEVNLAACTVPASYMGINGALRITVTWSNTNTAVAKTATIRYSASAGTPGSAFSTGTTVANQAMTISTAAAQSLTIIRENNAASSQSTYNQFTAYTAGGASLPSAITTTSASYVNIDCTDASSNGSTEQCGISGYTVELISP